METESKSILFVDDDNLVLLSLKRLFINKEWDVFFATGGAEGLQILNDQKIDLVIVDLHMPEMDGFTFLEKVRGKYPDIICFAMSGTVDEVVLEKVIETGHAQHVFSKPLKIKRLLETIRATLG